MTTESDKLAEALRVWIDEFGGIHDSDCPEDDTCDCGGKVYNNMANAALAAYDASQRNREGQGKAGGAWRCQQCGDLLDATSPEWALDRNNLAALARSHRACRRKRSFRPSRRTER